MNQIRSFEQHTPAIDPQAWLDPLSLVIGDVEIGAHSSLWPLVVARGDINRIRIGCETNIQDGCVLHNSHDGPYMPGGSPLLIGDRVTVGHRAILHGCHIGSGCLIGMGAIVMDKAVVEEGVIVGAGALVTPGKVLRSGFLYTGSPARRSRALSDTEREYLEYSAAHYVKLAARHRADLA
ncbi:MAG: gamma carbonic anhydrase family protein [Chromatiaceae bacterium]|nr:gamma carbonic anhydrase family protein [Chromatiaceae bacterium]MCP5315245.1 gamma carbonic anhydrase family protein [Chromatiaceae bacterium]